MFLHHEGALKEVDFVPCESEDLAQDYQVVRVRGRLMIAAVKTPPDIQNAFRHLIEKVSCPYGTFQLANSDVFFVHTWRQKQSGGFGQTGWATQDCFGTEEDEEECIVTNVERDQVKTVKDLWKYVRSPEEEEDEDDGFGVVDDKKKKKKKESKVVEKVGQLVF